MELYYTYMIMKRYGDNLYDVFDNRNAHFSKESIYSLGIQLINILERVHATGYVYNDLKLDNLLLDFGKNYKHLLSDTEDIFYSYNVNMIDMGFATRYIDKNSGQHISKKYVETYHGNLFFSSLNHLSFVCTSRRDDMISLLYLLIYLFENGHISGC